MWKWISALTVAMTSMSSASDRRVTDLGDGFVRVVTSAYTIEVPRTWSVSNETSWGQRNIRGTTGSMTTMTAGGPTNESWEQLYRTALYFINRESKGKATPYEIIRASQGYEAASWSMLNAEGFAFARYVILKSPKNVILVLSVKIPDRKREKELQAIFNRMVQTARIVD